MMEVGLIGQEVEILTTENLVFLGMVEDIEPNAIIIVRKTGTDPMNMRIVRSIIAINQIIAIRIREMLVPEED